MVAAEGLWHLGSLFYHDTYYSQWGWYTNLLWCDIPWNKAPHTGPRHIWRTDTLCPFSGREMNRDGSGVWWMILLVNAGYGSSWIARLLWLHLVSNQSRGEEILVFQLLQSNSSSKGAWNLSGYI